MACSRSSIDLVCLNRLCNAVPKLLSWLARVGLPAAAARATASSCMIIAVSRSSLDPVYINLLLNRFLKLFCTLAWNGWFKGIDVMAFSLVMIVCSRSSFEPVRSNRACNMTLKLLRIMGRFISSFDVNSTACSCIITARLMSFIDPVWSNRLFNELPRSRDMRWNQDDSLVSMSWPFFGCNCTVKVIHRSCLLKSAL